VEPQNTKQMDYPMHPQISVKDSLGTLAVNPQHYKYRRITAPLD
jgi:hypothetical protein